MLDRLMGGTIFAQSNGVMRHHMDDAYAHQRRQPRFRVAERQIPVERIVNQGPSGGIESLRPFDPVWAGGVPTATGLAPLHEDSLRDLERLVRPVQHSAGLCDLVGSERRAMC